MSGHAHPLQGFRDPQPEPPEVLLQRLFRRIGEVSSLPTVAIRIIDVANDPGSGADDLLDAVEIDASMATRIVRTVNSSFYALQNKVGDLKLAIALLGFNEVRNLSLTAYVAPVVPQKRRLWHLLARRLVEPSDRRRDGRPTDRQNHRSGRAPRGLFGRPCCTTWA